MRMYLPFMILMVTLSKKSHCKEQFVKKYFELIAPCHFGMEAVLKKEIIDLGYEISLVEDGRVTFLGDDEAICRANVFLRTA